MTRIGLLLVVATALACGGDDDGTVPGDGGATHDSGSPPDGGSPPLDGGSEPDSSVPPTLGHSSYVPPGLAPETATRLIVLGDSISAGTGASSAAMVYHALLAENADAAYPTDAETDLESLTGAPLEILDVSRGGAMTSNLIGQAGQVSRALELPASGHTIVVLTIGGNDLQLAIGSRDPTGQPLDDAIAAIRETVEFFQDPDNFADGTSIYIADVYDPSDGVAYISSCFLGLMLPELVAALDVWRDRYIELGTEMGFAVIDMLGHFHGHGFYNDDPSNPYYDAADPTHWFSDCIHPNDRGHHEIRRLFYEAMDPTYVVE